MKIEPRLTTQNRILVMGFKITTSTIDEKNHKDIPFFWQEYLNNGNKELLHNSSNIAKHGEYGICCNFKNDAFDYFLGVQVNDKSLQTFEYFTIPAGKFLVFTTVPVRKENFSSEIQNTWKYIYGEYLPNSKYKFDMTNVDYEYYDQKCMNDELSMDIYIPVVEKQICE